MNEIILCAYCQQRVSIVAANNTSATEYSCPNCGIVRTVIVYTRLGAVTAEAKEEV